MKVENPEKLQKTINICYDKKYKLSEIAEFIIKNPEQINVLSKCNKNYSGDGSLLKSLEINFLGLESSLIHFFHF